MMTFTLSCCIPLDVDSQFSATEFAHFVYCHRSSIRFDVRNKRELKKRERERTDLETASAKTCQFFLLKEREREKDSHRVREKFMEFERDGKEAV